MAAPMESSTFDPYINLIDELEASFKNSISLLTSQEHFNVLDSDDTKTSVDSSMQKFLELSRQMEAFFLRKKMLISYQKPEQVVSDDIVDLRAELLRKEQLVERHGERLKRCQLMLQAGAVTGGGVPPPPPHPPLGQQAVPPQQMPPQVPPAHHMAGGPPMSQYPPGPHPIHQMPPQSMGGQFPAGQGFPPPGPPMQAPPVPPQMQPHAMGMPPRPQPPSYPQGPLAYLEQTTSNIGMPDRR